MNTVVRRIILSSGAKGASLVIRTFEQLLLIPILIAAWGVELYGEWLLLSAVPVYLSISDFGFVDAGSNELSRRSENGLTAAVRGFYGQLFQVFSSWLALIAVLACAFVAVAPVGDWLNIKSMPKAEVSVIFILLVLQAIAAQHSLIFTAGLRATRQFHVDAGLRALMALLRVLGVLAGVSLGGLGPIGVAAIFLGSRIIIYVVQWIILERSDMSPLARPTEREPLGPYLMLGLDFMLLPLAQSIILQGAVVALGSVMGAVAVAVFSTHRTLTRMALQVVKMASHPLQAEAGLLQGSERRAQLARLVCSISRLTFWMALLISVLLILLGRGPFSVWTRGEIAMDVPLLSVLMLAALAEGVWRAAASVRLGTNRHRPLLRGYFVLSVLGMVVLIGAAKLDSLLLVACCVAGVDIGMAILTVVMNRDILGMHAMTYFGQLLQPPVSEIRLLTRSLKRR